MYWRYNNADGCVFQTKEARDYFSQSVRNKSVVIPNFIEQNDFLIDSWQNRRDEIAFVGRFDIPAKRPDIAVEAFKVVHELYPNYKLVFYGGGSGIGENIEVIKKLVDDYKINDFVTFAGIVKPVMKYISKAKIFLITSAYEGIPNVLLEALSIGLPCVSTDCSPGGARLLIQNHKNGILVKVNDVKAIADSLIYLINHPDIADEMGHRAKTDMKKYDPAIILPLWKEYIDSIIKRKARCVE